MWMGVRGWERRSFRQGSCHPAPCPPLSAQPSAVTWPLRRKMRAPHQGWTGQEVAGEGPRAQSHSGAPGLTLLLNPV